MPMGGQAGRGVARGARVGHRLRQRGERTTFQTCVRERRSERRSVSRSVQRERDAGAWRRTHSALEQNGARRCRRRLEHLEKVERGSLPLLLLRRDRPSVGRLSRPAAAREPARQRRELAPAALERRPRRARGGGGREPARPRAAGRVALAVRGLDADRRARQIDEREDGQQLQLGQED